MKKKQQQEPRQKPNAISDKDLEKVVGGVSKLLPNLKN